MEEKAYDGFHFCSILKMPDVRKEKSVFFAKRLCTIPSCFLKGFEKSRGLRHESEEIPDLEVETGCCSVFITLLTLLSLLC